MTDHQTFKEIFDAVIQALRACEKYSESTLNLWFSDMELTSVTPTSVVLCAKSDFKRDVILRNYTEALDDAFFKVLGYRAEINVRVKSAQGDASEEGGQDEAEADSQSENEPNYYATTGKKKAAAKEQNHNYPFDFTFDSFIVGSSNKFAHAACKAVANNPAYEYNPLFIYAPPGLGKTHLLYAITNQIAREHPELNIVYVKGEEFTNQMIDSISNNRTAQFRERYRKADVLLIDDIQFIAGKEATQEEFFHTFNDLYESHKQIILTSDRPPRDINLLEDRLKSRFEWGLLADIKPPDFELRLAILRKKAQSLNLMMPDEVLNYIAENLKNNVRQLEGAVKKIAAQAFLSGMPISLDLTVSCISDLITPTEPTSVTVEKIIELVSRHYGIPVDDLKGKKRNATIAMARHVSVYIIRKLTDMSLPAIAKIFNRDHTTIMSSLDKVESEMKNNPTLDIEIRELMKTVRE